MAFRFDEESREVRDAERGLVISIDETAPDRLYLFRIAAAEWNYTFIAETKFEDDDFQEDKILLWTVLWSKQLIPGMSSDETKDIIRESLMAFKYSYGKPASQRVRVDI